MRVILATDCDTTTKARLFMKIGDVYGDIVSGGTPTIVKTPYEDVQ
jgi:hypothetical protein